mmetsp:Transcript_28754/g.69672  ORF Transcript_28754/g.69672 Transcript_28754/m.69672 type:complete len:112 (-) Transcript_28754:221-556(-)
MRVSSVSLSILLAAILCASSSVVLAESIVSAREDGTNAEEEELPMAAVRRQGMNGINQPEDNRELEYWDMEWWRSGKGKSSSSKDGKGKGSSSDDGKGTYRIVFSYPRRHR